MTANHLSIDDAVDRICGSSRSTLILDSCVVLDVIRTPFRGEVPNETVDRAVQIAGKTENIELIVASIVPGEVITNITNVTADLQKQSKRLVDLSRDHETACKALGLRTHAELKHGSYSELSDELQKLAQRLVDAAIVFAAEDSIKLRAFDRSNQRLPPSTKGNQAKDCQIYEEVLEFSRRMRNKEYSHKIVFCTSNKNDYCQPNGHPLKTLANELAVVNVDFTTDLPWACSILGL